jgi:hypothetical protein
MKCEQKEKSLLSAVKGIKSQALACENWVSLSRYPSQNRLLYMSYYRIENNILNLSILKRYISGILVKRGVNWKTVLKVKKYVL